MKDEDTDWLLYHIIADHQGITAAELSKKSGLDLTIITASLERLHRAFLIEGTDKTRRVLSIGEAMIRCQVKNEPNLPYIIENGVIKAKKDDRK